MNEDEKREKRWNRRRAYLEDFQKNVAGEYVYTGKVHHFCDETGSRKGAMTALWAMALVMAAMAVAGGCLPAAGMQNTIYVLVPYVGALLSVVSVIWALCRLSSEKEPVRDFIYKATVAQFNARGTLAAVFFAATLVGDGVHLVLSGAGDRLPGTIVFLITQAVGLAVSLAWRTKALSLKWREQ